jgi:DNA-directed RNA polymerase specialized sigma24 family protein
MSSSATTATSAISLPQNFGNTDPGVWNWLIASYQQDLHRWVWRRLRGWTDRANLVEEVVARVWIGMWAAGGRRLRAYDPARASFGIYLRVLAENEVCRLGRERARRRAREASAGPAPRTGLVDEVPLRLVLEEFRARLTAREQWFLHEHLERVPPDGAARALSPSNRRKLKQRVLRKLRTFLATDETVRGGR